MKRLLLFLVGIFVCLNTYAETYTMDWYNDGQLYDQTTCQTGDDIELPTPPTKYGYTFDGWLTYQPIEYLESTGTQYIDTGIQAADISKLNITIQIKPNFVGADQKLFGNNTGSRMYLSTYQSKYRGTNINVTSKETQIQINLTDIDKQTYKAIISYNNEQFIATSWWMESFGGNIKTFILFAGYDGRNGIVKASYKCYQLQLYDLNENLVRDMVPVLDQDGTPCLFDKVEQKFYYNQGTGQFIAGPAI